MPVPARGSSWRAPGIESLFVATFALFGLRLGLRRLGDNSLFVHLRTGIDMLRSGSIPRVDPYSFTAVGHPWVVQSWLPEASYGIVYRLGGFGAVRLEHGLLYGLLAWLMARQARTSSPARGVLAAALAIGVGAVYWSPRPLAFGLVAFAVMVTVVEERRNPWLLVPVVWLWVNSHGSFPLGLGWLVLVGVGQWVDGRRRGEAGVPPPAVLPWLGAFLAGLAASAVNPLGPRLLAFPLTVLDKREAFRHVVEWRPLDVGEATAAVTLVSLAGAVTVVLRGRRQLGWSDLLPVAALAVMGLVAQRNLPVAAVALAPVLGRALGATGDAPAEAGPAPAPAPAPGSRRLNVALAATLGALALLFTAGALRDPPLALQGYPVRALRLAAEQGPLRRLVTDDVSAGYVILVHGTRAGVFIDDRVDLYPVELTLQYLQLSEGGPGSLDILERHRAEVVVWETKQALARRLADSPTWRRAGTRDGWDVFVRPESPAPPR